MKKRNNRRSNEKAWTPFVRCESYTNHKGERYMYPPYVKTYKNNKYQVQCIRSKHWKEAFCRKDDFLIPDSPMIWLSIKRIDRRVIRDWRELQRIKNELVGTENEAVEVFPAESRLVDLANQYHLWVFEDENYRIPFGWQKRRVDDKGNYGNSIQRPFKKE